MVVTSSAPVHSPGTYTYSTMDWNAYSNVANANCEFDTAAPGFLTLGLIGTRPNGSEFGGLELGISNAGTELFSQSFDNLLEAEAFFNDHALALDRLGGRHDVLIAAGFTVTERHGFGFGYVLGVSPSPRTANVDADAGGATVWLMRKRRRT